MAGWHHQLDGRGFGRTPGAGDGQGSLACCNSWGRKESDTTEQLNWEDPWRRKWQPTPVFLPGEAPGQKRLVGYSPRGHQESDSTSPSSYLKVSSRPGRKRSRLRPTRSPRPVKGAASVQQGPGPALLLGTEQDDYTGSCRSPSRGLCAVLCLVTQSRPTPRDPMDCSPQAPLSMGFSRQE